MSKIENTNVPNSVGNNDAYSPTKAESITFLEATEDFRPTANSGSLWQDISSEIWQNPMDQLSSAKEPENRKIEQIKKSDELNHPMLLAGFQRGVEDKIDLDLNSARVADRQDPLSNLIRNAQQLQDHLNWDKYQDYLSPATSRTSLGLDLIGSGQTKEIAAGEKLLLEAVSRRPELQFSREFQTGLLAGYEKMARTISAPYTAEPELPPKRTNVSAGESNNGSAAQLSIGFETAKKLGIKNAVELFDKAIQESDKTNSDALLDLRMETFRDRLVLDRTIVLENAAGHNTTKLYEKRSLAADKEWNAYQRYMEPAQVRSEIAFAYIKSGDAQLLAKGQTLLKEAVKLRPELEFTENFNRLKQQAYREHFEKRNGNSLEAKAPDKVLGVETNVIKSSEPEKKTATEHAVATPESNSETEDATIGFTDSDLKSLAQNALIGVVLAGAGYKLIQRGAKWAFERMNPAENSKEETNKPGEKSPIGAKPDQSQKIDELTRALETAQREKLGADEKLTAEKVAHEQKVEEFNTKLAEKQVELDKATEQNTADKAKLDQEVRDLRTTFDQYKEAQRLAAEKRATEITAMETRVTDLSTQLEQAQTAKTETTERLTKQLEASNSKVLELETALQKSETEGASAKGRVSELETTLADAQREKTESNSQLEAAQKRQAELEQQLREMQAAREADAIKAARERAESQQRESALRERLQQTETERDSAGSKKTEAETREAKLEERLRLAESEIRASGRRVEDLKQRLAEQRSYANENINRPRAETRVVPPPAVDEIPIETSPFQNAQGDSSPQLQRPEAAMEQAKRVEIQLPGGLVAKVAKRDVPRMLNTMERELGIEDIAKIFETAANDSTKTSEERAKWQQVRDQFKSLDAVAQEETKIELFNRLRADLGVPVKSEATTAGRGARFLNGGGVTLGVGIIAAAILHSTLSKANTSPQSAPVQVQFSGS
ncbi:hypothetical protein KF707_16080 [Candidatus Obscuribacterales bacterium]|nr:hypothetical protein [Candidatus Obscuribacterales bacterium]